MRRRATDRVLDALSRAINGRYDGTSVRERGRARKSDRWRRFRVRRIAIAEGRCERCGAAGPFDVHHLTYRHLGQERPDEVEVLCHRCHQEQHGHAF